MKVHELAHRAHTPAHVVRYYARIGLLKPARNPENRYRTFSTADLDRLCFIRSARVLGYSLDEIALLLQRLESGEASWPWLCEWFEDRRRHTRQTLDRLRRQSHHLDRLLQDTAHQTRAGCALPEVARWLADHLVAMQPDRDGQVSPTMAAPQQNGPGVGGQRVVIDPMDRAVTMALRQGGST
ncbi:MAG: MerR family transcriptional regulator [Pseudomonadota bacterium]